MKTTSLVFAFTFLYCFSFLTAFSQQTDDPEPVQLFLDSQEKYAYAGAFTGYARWQTAEGEANAGKFFVLGEAFQIENEVDDVEFRCDGIYLYEIIHRSKRIKKRHYDPLVAPAVVFGFRFYRLNPLSEAVVLAGKGEEVFIDVEFGSSIAQGNHVMTIDEETLDLKKVVVHANQDGFHETVEISGLRIDESLTKINLQVDEDAWKKKGYSILDLAKDENDNFMPEERALKD